MQNGKPFNKPKYDAVNKVRLIETEKIHVSEIYIIEGHLIFNNQELMDKMDLKIFIDTNDDVRLSRRVLKAQKYIEGNLEYLQYLLYQYEIKVKPAYEKYIEPSKKFADIIVPNYGFTTEKLDDYSLNFSSTVVDLIVQKVSALFDLH